MEITTKSKVSAVIKLIFGALMVITAILGYSKLPLMYWAEFTFFSNLLGGILLITDGILNLKGSSAPMVLYLNVGVGILTVFLVCLLTLFTPNPFNYGGAFFFLHAINPVGFLLIYILLCEDDCLSRIKRLLATPLLAMAYLLFDYILGNIRGFFVYGFAMPEMLPVPIAAVVGIVVFLLMMLLGLILLVLNKKAYRNYEY